MSAEAAAAPDAPAMDTPYKPLEPNSARFAGKYCLVTGASKGIGKATALRLAQEGAHVALHYGRDKAGAEDCAAQIAAWNREHSGVEEPRTLLLQADMGSEEAITKMFADYFAHWPRLDVCIPNAGTQTGSDSHEVEMASFDRIIDINLKGYFLCARQALKHFVEREGGPRGGVIVFDSSVHQVVPKPTYVSYACTKAAIGHMTATLALEYAERGVRVNCVGPGAIDTPMNAAWTGDESKRKGVCEHIPMGRPGYADEIAATFAFLASDEASYITGQTLFACGGLTLYPEFRSAWSSE